jgi:hypothetical protein
MDLACADELLTTTRSVLELLDLERAAWGRRRGGA